MRKTLTALLLIAVATPAAASECGEATWTNTTDQAVDVAVQVREGYTETTVEPGETINYWDSAPGAHWAIWTLDGTVLASGAQCGEDITVVNVEAPDVEQTVPIVEPAGTPVGVYAF